MRTVFALTVVWLSMVAALWPEPKRPAPLPLPMPDAEFLLVGDCEAWGWTYWAPAEFAKFGPRVQNLGLPSYRADHLRDDAHRLRGSRASLVVVHIGAADVSTSASPQAIVADITAALEEVRLAVPQASVLVLELTPRSNQASRARTDAVNALLREELDYGRVWDRGHLIGDFVELDYAHTDTLDGVHLTPSGYERLQSQLARHIGRTK